MNLKLNEIKKMSKILIKHDERINKLEKHHESMSLQITEIKNINQKLTTDLQYHIDSPNCTSPSTSSDVIMVGIPKALSGNPLTAVSKVLHSIGSASQVEDIFDICKVNMKSNNIIATSPKMNKSSSIVSFKSPQITAHIISKKRRHDLLTIKEAFSEDTKRNIFINEFWEAKTHALYRRVKEAANINGCKYVWTMQGYIFVCMHDKSEDLIIRTLSD